MSIALHALVLGIRRVKYSHLCSCLLHGRFPASECHGFRLHGLLTVPPASGSLQPTNKYGKFTDQSFYWGGRGGGGGGETNKAWDRETMFSQPAKRSATQRFLERVGNFFPVISPRAKRGCDVEQLCF